MWRALSVFPLRESGGKGSGRGVRSCLAGGTVVISDPVHPHQETVVGRAETRAELGECSGGRIPLPPLERS